MLNSPDSILLDIKVAFGPVVYVFKNELETLYVGSSVRGITRVVESYRIRNLHLESSTLEFIPCETEEEARLLEAAKIRDLKPKYNKNQYVGRKRLEVEKMLDEIDKYPPEELVDLFRLLLRKEWLRREIKKTREVIREMIPHMDDYQMVIQIWTRVAHLQKEVDSVLLEEMSNV